MQGTADKYLFVYNMIYNSLPGELSEQEKKRSTLKTMEEMYEENKAAS